ncbi:GNAT family N-acetyltransferase [Glaciihabitans sp. INWT7]|uniref:GNAT family N-acetyltransferase n=1 Tax=Glaciihabitans sp. INWT7 TaxID=2596912 RepID=UPI00162777D5|nr:GNAT family N-acetyltransferase [Glaciihabitans sp. INWT7]
MAAADRGDYGAPLRQQWLEVVRQDGSPCSAIICTRFGGRPFVAFVFTSHREAGRGLATALVAEVASRLRAEGESSLSLMVTVGNPAERVYERLGFRDAEEPQGTV